jgi:hypothetical protein
MSYQSRVNIQLGRIPEVEDDALYPLFQQIFNACHILNAAIDSTIAIVEVPEPGKPANESFTSITRNFWAPAADNVTSGRIVSIKDGASQFTRGVAGYSVGSYRFTDYFAVALEETNDEGNARLAWPPFVLEVDLASIGAGVGDKVYTDAKGSLYYLTPAQVESKYWPVGQVVAIDMVLFMPHIRT